MFEWTTGYISIYSPAKLVLTKTCCHPW